MGRRGAPATILINAALDRDCRSIYGADALMKWKDHPNLRKRPPAPSKGRGAVQVRIRRAFMASGAEVLSSSAIYDWTHARRRRGRHKSMPFGIYTNPPIV